MLHKNDFALEQLEERMETLCICVPYIGTCRRYILGWPFVYPCIKYRWICF